LIVDGTSPGVKPPWRITALPELDSINTAQPPAWDPHINLVNPLLQEAL